MRQKIVPWICSIAMLIIILVATNRCQTQQVMMQQWIESREIIIVTVPFGVGLDEYGYHYKPEWMHIQEYRRQILELNGMENCTLYMGQKLKLYKEGNKNA